MDFNLDKLVRKNIMEMRPYSTARHEYDGSASIFLDANENAFGSSWLNANPPAWAEELKLNRYPDPLQQKLKEKISRIKGIPPKNIFLGNGSDEAIDLLFRIFCEPGKDKALIFPPTYGMYEVCAELNDVALTRVPLNKDFQLEHPTIEESIDSSTKLLFICSPNNPSGNSINRKDIEIVLNNFEGIVIVDEAYINYARQKTLIPELTEYPNLVILQTLSKAWGLAGLRLGMAFASEEIIQYFNKAKYPYNLSAATQEIALEALENLETVNEWIKTTIAEREILKNQLAALPVTHNVYPSDANFLLVKMDHARKIYEYLVKREIIVRDRSKVILCEDCLRITVGTPEENQAVLKVLQDYVNEMI